MPGPRFTHDLQDFYHPPMNPAPDDDSEPLERGTSQRLTVPTREYIREYVHTRIAVIAARIDSNDLIARQSREAAQRASDKAEELVNTRMHSMNEFRDQLREQAADFVHYKQIDELRNTIKLQLDTSQGRLDALEKLIANWQGRLVIIGGIWALVIIIIGALVNYAIRTSSPSSESLVSNANAVQMQARLDALSARLNALTPPLAPAQK